jgi:hypothetical protein
MDRTKPVVLTVEGGSSSWELVPGGPHRVVWLFDGDPGVFDRPSTMLSVQCSRSVPALRGRLTRWPLLRATGPAAQHGPRAPVARSASAATYHVVVGDDDESAAVQLHFEDALGDQQGESLKIERADGWPTKVELSLDEPRDQPPPG